MRQKPRHIRSAAQLAVAAILALSATPDPAFAKGRRTAADPFKKARDLGVDSVIIEADPQAIPGGTVEEGGITITVGPNWRPALWLKQPMQVRGFIAPLHAEERTVLHPCGYEYYVFFFKEGRLVDNAFITTRCDEWANDSTLFVYEGALRARVAALLSEMTWKPSWRLSVEVPEGLDAESVGTAMKNAGVPVFDIPPSQPSPVSVVLETRPGKKTSPSGRAVLQEFVLQDIAHQECTFLDPHALKRVRHSEEAVAVSCSNSADINSFCARAEAKGFSCRLGAGIFRQWLYTMTRVRPVESFLRDLAKRIGHGVRVSAVPLVDSD